MSFTTTSNLQNLNGSCEIDSTTNKITSYTSSNTDLGAATEIHELANPQPHAKLTFTSKSTGHKVKYKVQGTLNSSNYDGSAEVDNEAKKDKHGVGDYEDTWTATAVTVQPAAAAKGY
jgi:hypothetical protein